MSFVKNAIIAATCLAVVVAALPEIPHLDADVSEDAVTSEVFSSKDDILESIDSHQFLSALTHDDHDDPPWAHKKDGSQHKVEDNAAQKSILHGNLPAEDGQTGDLAKKSTPKRTRKTRSSELVSEDVFSDEDLDVTNLANLDEVVAGTDMRSAAHCDSPLGKKDFMANTNSLVAYARSKKPSVYDEGRYPSLDIVQQLLRKLSLQSECSAKGYSSIMKGLMKTVSRGLPKYLLHKIDASMHCSKGGIISTRKLTGYWQERHYTGIKTLLRADRLGLMTTPETFVKWAVPMHEFEARMQEVIRMSGGETRCHGCVAFRATQGSPSGPRTPHFDMECDKKVPVEQVGYCECDGGFIISGRTGAVHAEVSCETICVKADTTGLEPTPVKASIRVRTGAVEDGGSKMSALLSFGGGRNHTISHLPAEGTSAVYDLHLTTSEEADLKSNELTMYGTDTDAWHYGHFEVKQGSEGKFVSYGPVHRWLVAKPYPKEECSGCAPFGADKFGDSALLRPFTTKVHVAYTTGSVANAAPSDPILGPDLFVEGSKLRGQFFHAGRLQPAGANSTAHSSFIVRRDIGDVEGVKLVAQKAKGSEWFFTSLIVDTKSDYEAHVHKKKKMHPTHLWIAPEPFRKDERFYSFNSKAASIELTPKVVLPKWDGRTCGGTAPKHSKCKFPFMHGGKEYHECTTAGKSQYERWCETETKGTWAYCDCDRYTTWKGTAGPGQQCKFPFKKNGKWHRSCIKAEDFQKDLTFECNGGKRCDSNTLYSGVCSIDTTYKGRWGECQPRGQKPSQAVVKRYTNGQGSSPAGTECVLPFFYGGIWNEDCMGDQYGGHGWCATTLFFNIKKWGGCRKALPPAERYIRWPDDVTKVVGQNSAPDDRCVFPFHHHGGTYYNCVDAGPATPHGWCSLDKFFKGRWGACAHDGYRPQRPEKGARWTDGVKGTVQKYTDCKFPFFYRGKKFSSCVGRSESRPHGWCSTTQNFANKWGTCLPPGEQPPKQDCELTQWSKWDRGDAHSPEGCSASEQARACEGHTRRVRSVKRQPRFGGKPCSILPGGTFLKQSAQCKAAAQCAKTLQGSVTNSLTGDPINNAEVRISCKAGATTALLAQGPMSMSLLQQSAPEARKARRGDSQDMMDDDSDMSAMDDDSDVSAMDDDSDVNPNRMGERQRDRMEDRDMREAARSQYGNMMEAKLQTHQTDPATGAVGRETVTHTDTDASDEGEVVVHRHALAEANIANIARSVAGAQVEMRPEEAAAVGVDVSGDPAQEGHHGHMSAESAQDTLWTKTAMDGKYSIEGVAYPEGTGGSCSIVFSAEGFIQVVDTFSMPKQQSKATKNISLRPIPSSGEDGTVSFTLNWGEYPTDLDLHALWKPPEGTPLKEGQQTHFYWISQGSATEFPFVMLDHDEMNGRGPETVSIHEHEGRIADGTYEIYVKCFSCTPTEEGQENTEFPESMATVTATYGLSQLLLPLSLANEVKTLTYRLKEHASGKKTRFWNVITVTVTDGKVSLVPHLKYVKDEPKDLEPVTGA